MSLKIKSTLPFCVDKKPATSSAVSTSSVVPFGIAILNNPMSIASCATSSSTIQIEFAWVCFVHFTSTWPCTKRLSTLAKTNSAKTTPPYKFMIYHNPKHWHCQSSRYLCYTLFIYWRGYAAHFLCFFISYHFAGGKLCSLLKSWPCTGPTDSIWYSVC